MKGKFFEGSSCKTFVLTGYCDEYPRLLKEGKEIIMYQDREDLLEKINYYLKHEKEREKIANITYKKISPGRQYAMGGYVGMQKTRLGPPFPLFGDPVTRTTFTLQAGETLGEALARKRWQFGIGEFRP